MDPAAEPVRRAGPSDAGPLADLFRQAGATVGRGDAGAARDCAAEAVDGSETWVVGLEHLRAALVLDGDRIAALVVDPMLAGQGIGRRLLALAQMRRPDGLTAAVPADDETARSFLSHAGFVGASAVRPGGTVSLRWSPPVS